MPPASWVTLGYPPVVQRAWEIPDVSWENQRIKCWIVATFQKIRAGRTFRGIIEILRLRCLSPCGFLHGLYHWCWMKGWSNDSVSICSITWRIQNVSKIVLRLRIRRATQHLPEKTLPWITCYWHRLARQRRWRLNQCAHHFEQRQKPPVIANNHCSNYPLVI